MELNNFLIRTITALFYGVIMIGSVLLGLVPFFIVLSVIIILSVLELNNLFKLIEIKIKPSLLILFCLTYLVVYLLNIFNKLQDIVLLAIIFCLFIFYVLIEFFIKSIKPIHNIVFTLFTFFYVTIPISLLLNYVIIESNLIYSNSNINLSGKDLLIKDIFFLNKNNEFIYTSKIIIAFYSIIWIYDTFAYLIGVSLGKRKLLKHISPNKTVEGFIGGLLITIFISLFFRNFFNFFSTIQWVIFSFIIAIFATIGDLFESMIKRFFKVKDTGNILPGHGGILDRIDSILIASPIGFLLLKIFL